ncbi:MAG TPA: cyclic peptide export ABC transporter [Rhizobium sp.]
MTEALKLLRPYWLLTALGTAVGILSGVATASLLATINASLHGKTQIGSVQLAAFIGLCLLSVGGTAWGGALNSAVGQRFIAALRKDIALRVLRTPIAEIERQGPHRLMAILTNDVDTVSAFTFNFSGYAIALAVTLASFVYLLSLSPLVFAIALASLAFGIVVNFVGQRGWIRDYEQVRVAQDDLQNQYSAIINGAKELKISRPRRQRVFAALLSEAADRIASLKTRAMRLFWTIDAIGSVGFFAAIGLLIVLQSRLGLDASVISGAVIVLLYIKAPITQLASALPAFDQAKISLMKIAKLSADLGQSDLKVEIGEESGTSLDRPSAFHAIDLKDVAYDFSASGSGGSTFVLGPLDLSIRAGELLFIVGENGSGKTTLIKLLLGLYIPTQGRIFHDGEEVTTESRDDYRQLFATVFSDYYLFEDLASPALSEDPTPLLSRLGIAHKVGIEHGRFTTLALSTGQRKRLALVQAWLERRPLIVTDEWAADQDPEFRRVFYEELLPKLRAEGRTLIIISHDDRYFHVADRVVRMDGGMIVADGNDHRLPTAHEKGEGSSPVVAGSSR